MSGKKEPPDDATYEVGYARTPKHTRWKPGQSGNPRGRIKGVEPIADTLKRTLRRKLTVTEGGKRVRLAALEIVLRRLANNAMRGETKALKMLFDLLSQYGPALSEKKKPDYSSIKITATNSSDAVKEYLRLVQGGSDDE